MIKSPALENTRNDSEFEDYASRKPPFIVRWGSFFFFVLLAVIFSISWLIRYPDIVNASGKITSINSPKEVIARSEGKIARIFFTNGSEIKKGEVVAYIDNSADFDDVLLLSDKLDSVENTLQRSDSPLKTDFFQVQFSHKLGELQTPYQLFIQSLQDFSSYLVGGYNIKKRKMLIEDLKYLRQLHSVLITQREYLTQDLLLADTTFRANESLHNQLVISSFEYRSEKSKVLSKELAIPQISSTIISNESQQHEKVKEVAELDYRTKQQQTIFVEALNTLKSKIEDWKLRYVLMAPTSGRLTYATFIQENQQVRSGQLLGFVTPKDARYFVVATIPQYNFGKVILGQPVLLKFPAYPFQEFGIFRGSLEAVSPIPTDSGFLSQIALPGNFKTSQSKSIIIKNGLSVNCEIITKNKRMLQIILEGFTARMSR